MTQAQPYFLTDQAGNKLSVVLPLSVYEQMLADLEEMDDIRLYDAVKSRQETTVPFADYVAQRAQRNG